MQSIDNINDVRFYKKHRTIDMNFLLRNGEHIWNIVWKCKKKFLFFYINRIDPKIYVEHFDESFQLN